jgi:CheY-like chemotaxis protein
MNFGVNMPRSDNDSYVILLVEDDEGLHCLARELFEDAGYKVISAFSGVEAMQFINNPNLTVDLVFSDVRMPFGVSGFDVARAVHQARPNTPVLLTTGYSEDSLRNDTDYIAVEIISKPVQPRLLLRRIQELIEL